jgi:hypothetical protein
MTRPLTNLLIKELLWEWTPEQEDAFNGIKLDYGSHSCPSGPGQAIQRRVPRE